MMESDIIGLKSQVKVSATVGAKINSLENAMTDINFDLNNKIASLRGMMARSTQTTQRSSGYPPAALPSHVGVSLDPKIEQAFESGVINKKQYELMYQAKGLSQLMDSITGEPGQAGSHQEKAFQKQGDEPLSPAPGEK